MPTPPAPRKPLQKRSREKRERLLAAARALVAEGGTEAAGPVQVAKQAGVPVGSVYFYFPDPVALLEALASAWLAGLREQFAALAAAPLPEAGWVAWLDGLLTITYGRPGDVTDRRFELEMARALEFYPALRETREHHARLVSGLFAGMLRQAGSTWPDARLQQLARLGFEMIGALDHCLLLPGTDARLAREWMRNALFALLSPCFNPS